MDAIMFRRFAVLTALFLVLTSPVWGPQVLKDTGNSVAAVIQAMVTISGNSATPLASFAPVEVRENSTDYKFINPLLYVGTDRRLFTAEFNDLNNQLSSYAQTALSKRRIVSMSVYYRDLNSGHWTGYNEDKPYEPSSLLKVIVMIAYFRKAYEYAALSSSTVDDYLSQQLYYPGEDTSGQNYPPQNQMATGTYSIGDLITDMIQNSDNTALNVLMSNNPSSFSDVYSDFRLPPIPQNSIDYMTARSYSIIFRTLYNSTYLPWYVSERALSLLASTTFNRGLVAGVPPNVPVLHKFGEHTNTGTDHTTVMWRELHDCGIIYYPNRPYLLCVMTSGQDFSQLEKIITDVSAMAYRYTASLPAILKN